VTGDHIQVTVSDDGPGIPAEDVERIFERFLRVDSAGKGSGLGLAIASDLVQMHAGTLSVEEGRAVGAAFHVTLPVSTDWG
jgi:signal transduction histidine kinase